MLHARVSQAPSWKLSIQVILVPYLGATGEEQAVECITFGRDDLVKQPRDRGA